MTKKSFILYASTAFAVVLILIIAIMVIGSKTRKEEDQPMFQRVKLALEDADPHVGLSELKYYLGKRPDSAEGHLLLANLYDERLGMPLEAIFEYQTYLELAGDKANREEIEMWITAARKRCFLEWSKEFGDLYNDSRSAEIIDLRNEVRELRYQLQQLTSTSGGEKASEEDQLAAKSISVAAPSPAAASATAAASAAEAVKPAEESPEPQPVEAIAIYTVTKGDNLARISQKFYNTSANAGKIYEYNKDVLKSPNLLQIGQKLKIPPAEKVESVQAEPATPLNRKELPPIKPLSDEQLNRLRGNRKPSAPPEEKAASAPAVENDKITPYLYGAE